MIDDAFDQIGLRQRRDDRRGRARQPVAIVDRRAAPPGIRRRRAGRPARDRRPPASAAAPTCLQQRIADRMAERVVDVLEPVEIDQEQRAARAAPVAAQRLVERLAHPQAVGQAGQASNSASRVISASDAALLGEVGADAAEAQEAAVLVEDRRARDRPPAIAARSRSPGGPNSSENDGARSKGGRPSVRSVSGRRAIDRGTARSARCRSPVPPAIQFARHLGGQIGHAAVAVGLPEPARRHAPRTRRSANWKPSLDAGSARSRSS